MLQAVVTAAVNEELVRQSKTSIFQLLISGTAVISDCFIYLFFVTVTTQHLFNGLFSRTSWLSQHQEGKPFWILMQQHMMGWQWYHLDHMQIICTSLQIDNNAST